MVSAAPLSTRASMRDIEVVDDACRSAFGCGGLDVSTIALVLVTVVLAVLVFATIVHVREATSLVEEETERLEAERDAFDAFARRVANLEVAEAAQPVTTSGGVATVASTAPDDRLDRVRTAYRETVMDVPHYEADYGEALAENLSAEFGDEIAYAVEDGRQLTPQLKSALLDASREASRNRSSFISTLEAEADALADAASEMEELDGERASVAAAPVTERSYEELVADWKRLGRLGERCRQLTRSRQEQIRSTSAAIRNAPDLHSYLYDEIDVTYPVLADAVSLSDTIEDLRSRFLDSITRRV